MSTPTSPGNCSGASGPERRPIPPSSEDPHVNTRPLSVRAAVAIPPHVTAVTWAGRERGAVAGDKNAACCDYHWSAAVLRQVPPGSTHRTSGTIHILEGRYDGCVYAPQMVLLQKRQNASVPTNPENRPLSPAFARRLAVAKVPSMNQETWKSRHPQNPCPGLRGEEILLTVQQWHMPKCGGGTLLLRRKARADAEAKTFDDNVCLPCANRGGNAATLPCLWR